VQPVPQPNGARGNADRGSRNADSNPQSETRNPQSPFGAGCDVPSQTGGGGAFFGGGQTGGPWVLAGTYNVSLVVDGKTVDTKPLRVVDDPDVALTSLEKKRMFDMATEMHELQKRVTDAQTAQQSLSRQMTDLAKTIADRNDVPADVKSQFESLNKDLTAFAPRIAAPQGRGGGRGGENPSVAGRISQAKNGLMGGMPVTEQTTRAYTEAKSQAPKAIADLNALIARASTMSGALARYNLTLTVPQPVQLPAAAPAKRASSQQ